MVSYTLQLISPALGNCTSSNFTSLYIRLMPHARAIRDVIIYCPLKPLDQSLIMPFTNHLIFSTDLTPSGGLRCALSPVWDRPLGAKSVRASRPEDGLVIGRN